MVDAPHPTEVKEDPNTIRINVVPGTEGGFDLYCRDCGKKLGHVLTVEAAYWRNNSGHLEKCAAKPHIAPEVIEALERYAKEVAKTHTAFVMERFIREGLERQGAWPSNDPNR